MNWSAWDSEGNKYTEETHTWIQVPTEYTVHLTLHRPPDAENPTARKNFYNGHDAIWWDGQTGRAYNIDIPPPLANAQNIRALRNQGTLKWGILVPDPLWIQITEEAKAEPLRAA